MSDEVREALIAGLEYHVFADDFEDTADDVLAAFDATGFRIWRPSEQLREEAAQALYEAGDRFGNSRSTTTWADAGNHYRGWIRHQADAVLAKVAEHSAERR